MIETISVDEHRRRIQRPRTRQEEIPFETPSVELTYANGRATIEVFTHKDDVNTERDVIASDVPMTRDAAVAWARRVAEERGIRFVVVDALNPTDH